MVRKSSIAAAVLGCLFLVAGCVLWVRPIWRSYLSFDALQIAVVCFWFPLLHRPERPLKPSKARWIRVVGGMYLLAILGWVVLFRLYPWHEICSFGAVPLIHLVAGAYLFLRPRLLLCWSVSGLLVLPLTVFIGMAATGPRWAGTGNAAALAVDWLTLLGLVVGSALALYVAWMWTLLSTPGAQNARPHGE